MKSMQINERKEIRSKNEKQLRQKKKKKEKIMLKEKLTNILALGRRITKHDDGATIGYVEVDARNVVVAFELIDCELALLQVVDIDEDGYDPNDDVEFDTFVVIVVVMATVEPALAICSLKLH